VDKTTKLDLTLRKTFFKNKRRIGWVSEKYISFKSQTLLPLTWIRWSQRTRWKRYERAYKRLEIKKKTKCCRRSEFVCHFIDPHSIICLLMNRNFNIQMQLSLEGIGATPATKMVSVIDNWSQAVCRGSGQLQSQDKIISVAQGESNQFDSVIDLPLREVVSKNSWKVRNESSLKRLRKLRWTKSLKWPSTSQN